MFHSEKMSFICCEAIYEETFWGGQGFNRDLRRLLAYGNWGKCWDLIDQPEHNSKISDGPFRGMHLRQAIEQDSERILGPRWNPQQRLPVTVQWWDVADSQFTGFFLSPDAAMAKKIGQNSLCQYVICNDATPNSTIYAGFYRTETPATFGAAKGNSALTQLIYKQPFLSGESMIISAGCPFGFTGRCLFVSLQENAPGFLSLRDSAEENSLWDSTTGAQFSADQFVRYDCVAPRKFHSGSKIQIPPPPFRLRRLFLKPGDQWLFKARGQARILILLGGILELNEQKRIARGDSILLCYGWMNTIRAIEAAEVLFVDGFARDSTIFDRD